MVLRTCGRRVNLARGLATALALWWLPLAACGGDESGSGSQVVSEFIAFHDWGEGTAWLISPDGSEQHEICDDCFHPLTSPDGRYLAFLGNRHFEGDGDLVGGDLFVVSVDGSHKRNLTDDVSLIVDYAWSPDSMRLAYRTDGDVYVVDIDGAQTSKLTSEGVRASRTGVAEFGGDLSWSPDSSMVVFVGEGDVRHDVLHTVTPDGASHREILLTSASPSVPRSHRFSVFSPRWSPDGRWIAFLSEPVGSLDLSVFIVGAEGGPVRELTPDLGGFGEIHWSPDSTRLLAIQHIQFLVVFADSGSFKRVTAGRWAAWSPDGRRVAYSTGTDIFIINPDDLYDDTSVTSNWKAGSPLRYAGGPLSWTPR